MNSDTNNWGQTDDKEESNKAEAANDNWGNQKDNVSFSTSTHSNDGKNKSSKDKVKKEKR